MKHLNHILLFCSCVFLFIAAATPSYATNYDCYTVTDIECGGGIVYWVCLPNGTVVTNTGSGFSTTIGCGYLGASCTFDTQQTHNNVSSIPVGYDYCGGTASDGSCGSATTIPTETPPSTGLCAAGNATSPTLVGTNYEWVCEGVSGGADSPICQAPHKINGVCGTANGIPSATQPTINLCGVGAVSNQSTASPWTWECDGQNTGSTASCFAPPPAAPPSFGGACP